MGCDCGPGEACGVPPAKTDKLGEAQKMRKYRQYVIYGTVVLLFALRWFHILDSLFGIDTALLAIFIGSAQIYLSLIHI